MNCVFKMMNSPQFNLLQHILWQILWNNCLTTTHNMFVSQSVVIWCRVLSTSFLQSVSAKVSSSLWPSVFRKSVGFSQPVACLIKLGESPRRSLHGEAFRSYHIIFSSASSEKNILSKCYLPIIWPQEWVRYESWFEHNDITLWKSCIWRGYRNVNTIRL